MGADIFSSIVKGKSAVEAFEKVKEDAQWEHGHGGYTGTIAEKDSFIMLTVPDETDPIWYADELIKKGNSRVDNKWGPAGCILLAEGEDEMNKYLFFGWASS